MALSEEKIRKYIQRLLLSRMRILCNHGFYGLLLMHMIYAVDEEVETACTDGKRITFGTDFLDSLSDAELDFVMMHEVLHVVLQHCLRGNNRDPENFNIACDIVVNSNILLENNMKSACITLSQYGESMHLTPNGKEGYEYTAEQVYEMLPKQKKKPQAKSGGSGDGKSGNASDNQTNHSGVAKGRAKHQQAQIPENMASSWNDHSRWGMYEEDDAIRDVWVKRFEDAAEAISIARQTSRIVLKQ